MKRIDFINKFNETYPSFSFHGDTHEIIKNIFLDLDENIFFKGKNEYEIDSVYLYKHFEAFFKELNITNSHIMEKLHFHIEENYMGYEDDDRYEKEKLRSYQVSFNLNELYDTLMPYLNIESKKQKIYRMELKTGKGLFDGVGASALKSNDHCLPPHEDGATSYVFIDSTHAIGIRLQKAYSDNWFFGFKSLKDIDKWFPDKSQIERLVKAGCVIKEFEIDSKYAIEGNNQIAFIKNKATLIKEYDFHPKQKAKLKITG